MNSTKLIITLLLACSIICYVLQGVVATGTKPCKYNCGCHYYKNCTKPSPRPTRTRPLPSPTVPRNPTISLIPIPTGTFGPDIYPVPSVIFSCLLLPRQLTSLTNIPLTNCLDILRCLKWWVQHYLQFVLRGLTPGANFPLFVETNGALSVGFTEFERILGVPINEFGNGTAPLPTICTLDYSPVLAGDGRIYSNACVARSNGAPAPYIPVDVSTPSGGTFPTNVPNASTVLIRFYLQAALRLIRFILTFLQSCLLSTDVRVLNDALARLTLADTLILANNFVEAKNQVLAVTNTL
ncbi:hypothetical protein ABK040_011675 [Willaertia magna]